MSYYDWLIRIVLSGHYRRDGYGKLLFALYSTEFYWTVKRDGNREKDGLDLREQYEYETGLYCDEYGPCSVLEAMIAMAIRCENELMYMYDPDVGDQTSRWFWMMIDNLGLDEFDDSNMDLDEVNYILDRFMNREYGKELEFCPFPVTDYIPGFKKMELAYQMNHYIKENFY